jgi:hypothetical protein
VCDLILAGIELVQDYEILCGGQTQLQHRCFVGRRIDGRL